MGGTPAFPLQVLEPAPADAVVEPGQGQHDDRGGGRSQTQGGVAQPDHGHVHHDPRGVEEGDQTVGGEHRAEGRDVADAFRAHGVRRARRSGHDGGHHR